jgi:hypothetical protein
MRTTWEKIVHHVGTIYGQDISNELLNKKRVILSEPEYSTETLAKHALKVARNATQAARLMEAREVQRTMLQEAVNEGLDADTIMEPAILENEIEEAPIFQGQTEIPIKLTDIEDVHSYKNQWRTFRERSVRLEKQRGQAFSMIRGHVCKFYLIK